MADGGDLNAVDERARAIKPRFYRAEMAVPILRVLGACRDLAWAKSRHSFANSGEERLKWGAEVCAAAEALDRALGAMASAAGICGKMVRGQAASLKDAMLPMAAEDRPVDAVSGHYTRVEGRLTDVVEDPAKLPADYWRVVPERREPDMQKLGAARRATLAVPGAGTRDGAPTLRFIPKRRATTKGTSDHE